jgi:hypothetical protein
MTTSATTSIFFLSTGLVPQNFHLQSMQQQQQHFMLLKQQFMVQQQQLEYMQKQLESMQKQLESMQQPSMLRPYMPMGQLRPAAPPFAAALSPFQVLSSF